MSHKELIDKQILDTDEQELGNDLESGAFQSVQNLEGAKQSYQQIAKDARSKTKSITIRFNEYDLQKLKAKAISLGIPYQTLIGSVLHQFAKRS
jgi:predicted DNA binding CopG/RHH family protein